MAGLPMPDFGAVINAQRPNPVAQFAQAMQQIPQMREQQQMNGLAVKNAQQQLQFGQQNLEQNSFQLEQAKRQSAQQQWNMLGNFIKTRPHLTSDPNIIAKARGLAEQLGMPAQITDANGNLDANLWKTPWSQLDPAMQLKITQEALQYKPGDARNAFLSDYGGVPQSLITAEQSFDGKSSAALSRASTYGVHVTDEGAWLRERSDYQKAITDPTVAMLTDRGRTLLAQARQYDAQADAIPRKISIDFMNAQAHMKSADAAMARAMRIGSVYGTASAKTAKAIYDQQRRVLVDDLGQARTALSNYLKVSLSTDPSTDPKLAALQQAVTTAEQAVQQIDAKQSDALSFLASGQGYSNALSAQSGKAVTVTSQSTPGKSKFTPGQVYQDANGNKAKYNADGTWTPVQ